MSLNCIVAMSDRLLGREARPRKMTSSGQQEVAGDTNSENTGETSRVAQAKIKFVSNFLGKGSCEDFSVSCSLLLPLLPHILLAGAAAPTGGHPQGLRARGGGEGPGRHDLRGPAGGGVLNGISGTCARRPKTPRCPQPGGKTGNDRSVS